MIIIPIKWLFHWEYTLFSDKPNYLVWSPQQLPAGSSRIPIITGDATNCKPRSATEKAHLATGSGGNERAKESQKKPISCRKLYGDTAKCVCTHIIYHCNVYTCIYIYIYTLSCKLSKRSLLLCTCWFFGILNMFSWMWPWSLSSWKKSLHPTGVAYPNS